MKYQTQKRQSCERQYDDNPHGYLETEEQDDESSGTDDDLILNGMSNDVDDSDIASFK